jgi:hypothetical protein
MTKWEYKIYVWPEHRPDDGVPLFETPQSVEAILNRMGAAGWELVSYENLPLSYKNTNTSKGAFTFKRPLTP